MAVGYGELLGSKLVSRIIILFGRENEQEAAMQEVTTLTRLAT